MVEASKMEVDLEGTTQESTNKS